MRKLLIAITFLCANSYLMAQNNDNFKHRKWKPSSVGLTATTYSLHTFSDLSYESLFALVQNPSELDFEMRDFESIYQAQMYVTSIGAYLRLSKPISKSFSEEISLGVNYSCAEILIDFKKEESNQNTDYLTWCLVQDRFELESTYYLKYSYKAFNIKAGPGILLSSSFNDKVMLLEGRDNQVPSQIATAKPTRFLLAHLSIELSAIVLKRFELSFGHKYGVGWQLREDNYINKTITTTLGLGYVFNK